ncbi:MAG: hypothetical protein M1821_009167 [Bathelium mastoideum]|nr:MAG: hypothetical protein M1821_009167 [Bathelium mastoideum]
MAFFFELGRALKNKRKEKKKLVPGVDYCAPWEVADFPFQPPMRGGFGMGGRGGGMGRGGFGYPMSHMAKQQLLRAIEHGDPEAIAKAKAKEELLPIQGLALEALAREAWVEFLPSREMTQAFTEVLIEAITQATVEVIAAGIVAGITAIIMEPSQEGLGHRKLDMGMKKMRNRPNTRKKKEAVLTFLLGWVAVAAADGVLRVMARILMEGTITITPCRDMLGWALIR